MAKVSLEIEGRDSGASALVNTVNKSVYGLKGAVEGMISPMSGLKDAVGSVGAAFGAWKIVEFLKDSTLMAARYETLGAAMTVVGNNAGYTKVQMDGFESALRKTGIAMIESRETLTKMASAHIDLSKSTQLARVAQDAAVIGGINSSEAFSRMVQGIQSAEVEVLRNIGINVNFEESYKKMAKQLNKNADDLSEYEKVQARTNAVIDKGKDIAGAYEAAMGTAGKQILSMKRYADDLKVKVGEVFQDALSVAVMQLTDGLKSVNGELDDMAKKNQLEAWGRTAVKVLAFVADAIRYPIIMFKSLFLGIVEVASAAVSAGIIIGRALKGDLKGASDEWQVLKGSYSAYKEDIDKMWAPGSSFQEKAAQYFDMKDAAAKNKSAFEEQQKARIAAGNANREADDAKQKQIQNEKKFLENLKNSVGGIKDYTSAAKDLGNELLKLAGEQYGENLKTKTGDFQIGKNPISGIGSAMTDYAATVGTLFDAKSQQATTGLTQTLDLLDKFKKTVANPGSKEAKAGLAEILNAYKDNSVAIIEIEKTRVTTLVEGERKLAAEFKTIMDTKKKELEALKIWIADVQKSWTESLAPKVEYNSNFDKYFGEMDKLAAKQKETAAIEDPVKRLEEQKKLVTAYSEYKTAVVDGGEEIVSAYEVQQRSQKAMNDLTTAMTNDVAAQGRAASDAYAASKNKIVEYENQLKSLDALLSQVRTVKIDFSVDTSALVSALDLARTMASATRSSAQSNNAVQQVLSGASGWRPGMTASDYYQDGDSMRWGDGSYAGPAYENGTDYVPRTGIALVHKGEKITPASQNTGSGSITIQGGITISLPNVTDRNTADDLLRQLIPKLNDYNNSRKRAA